MAAFAADRDLLFGLLALQNGLIDQVQLVAAFQAWTRHKGRPLAEHLLDRGDLDADQRAGVDAMVALHLKKHGGNAARSLAAIPAGRSTRESLAQVGDSYLEASLALVRPASTQAGEDAEVTTTYSVGKATSDGQRFRVLRPHARGGLGAIFVALDTELRREVALKQILDNHADDTTSRARFLLEAEITGGLEHPGIVPVYGLGTYPDGRPYYAMRFIRGDSLKQAIATFHSDQIVHRDRGRRSLALRKLLRTFLDVCNAIDYAHSRGVLHRDLKPSNIIVGNHGETLVVDWGLAKALGRTEPRLESEERLLVPSLSSGSAETLPGSALGTPAYMSPEQAVGDLEHLGPWSDVYSLGATLYCLLSGRPPFENDDVGTVLRAVQKGHFAPPRAIDPTIDAALEAVCLKALALKPQDRYPTPRALAEDIERWTADEPVTAWREPIARRARRWARRNRTAMTAAAVAVLVALAGMASVLAVQARANAGLKLSNDALLDANTREGRANADLRAANERERARFSLALDAVGLFTGEVSEDLLLKEKPFEGLRTKLLRGAADFYGKLEGLLAGQTDRASLTALGRAYDALGELTDNIGSKPQALAVHRRALAVRRELAGAPETDAATQADVARSLLAIGSIQYWTGDMSGALESYEETLGLAERLSANASADESIQALLGLALQRIGKLFADTSKPAAALESYERALEIRQKLAGAHPDGAQLQSDLGTTYDEIGVLLIQSGKPAEALDAWKRGLEIRQKLAGAHPDVAEFQTKLASSHERIAYRLLLDGNPAEALSALERVQPIRQQLADANPNVTEFQFQLSHSQQVMGWALKVAGKPAEALAAFERALATMQELADINPNVPRWQSDLALSLESIGGIQLKAGRTAEGVASVRRAIAIWKRLPSPTPYDLYNWAATHALLAAVAAERGSGMTAAEGRAHAERAMESLRLAVAAGYRKLEIIRTDRDLDPLRSRRDFQDLMMDLEFPDDPLARGD
jgi:serine/threonine-protein kinase